MPTLYTALSARHGKMPRSSQAEWIPKPTPEFAEHMQMASERVAAPPSAPAHPGEVIVVGAGFAGLSAAYELLHAGYKVTVLEGQRRLGGRVQSLSDVVPGKNVEGGGELIGNNHHAWLHYAARFRLNFLCVDDGGNAPIELKGRKLDKPRGTALWKEVDELFDEMAKLSMQIQDPYRPWCDGMIRDQYDKISLHDWVQSQKSFSALCKYAVELQFSTDNGVTAEQQSMLGVLAMIAGGRGKQPGGEKDYFTETERNRCDGGNQQLAQKLAEPLGGNLHLGHFVERIHKSAAGMEVETRNYEGKPRTFKAKDVILAVSPNVWPKLDPGILPHSRPQMGKNIKCLMTFNTEYWNKSKYSPNLTSDRPLELTWHGTEGQRGPGHALVGFSGATQAEETIRWKPVDRPRNFVGELSRVYPGSANALVDLRFKDWPDNRYVMASYAFPAPNEITTWGPIYDGGVGNLHFAGEHTCYAFIGYMEGALQSGIRASNRLMVRDKLAQPIR